MENKIAISRLFAAHSFALSQGINPVSPLLPKRCVHTRLETDYERFMREKLECANYELQAIRVRHRLQKKNARIARNLGALVRHIEMEENRKDLQNLDARRELWRRLVSNRESMLGNVEVRVLDLTDAVENSVRTVESLTAERDEARAHLARQRELAEDAESRRKVAVSSLRQRCGYEKALLLDEIEELREAVRKKDFAIKKLNEFCEESVQQIEAQDCQIALYESNEAMDSFSREISCTLSEMGEVVLMRKEDEESVGEKMRDLRDGVRDLVREVKNRRQHSHKMTERIYTLEEERLMWSIVE